MWHHREAKIIWKETEAELKLWKAGWIIRKDLEEVWHLALGGSLQREEHLQENKNPLCYEQRNIL